MAGRRQYKGRYRGRPRSSGSERARQHIREAANFSAEVGGTDRDIKEYFFSLEGSALEELLDEYEKANSKKAREYAEFAIPLWRSGKRKMSGEVAKRLFTLLPDRMPMRDKMKLVETLWRHKGPSSNRTLYIGPDVDVQLLGDVVREHFASVVTKQRIPEEMEKRFTWLAGNDVDAKQQLLNHFLQLERGLLDGAVERKVPMLISQVSRQDHGHFNEVLEIGKHTLRIVYSPLSEGLSDSPPPTPEVPRTGCSPAIVIFIIVLLLILSGL